MNAWQRKPIGADRQLRRRAGLTLVELLVVIGIIATLVGLLLPAVNIVIESGRRSGCLQNQKQIALAAAQYTAANRQLPGYRNEVVAGGIATYPSWPVLVLPHLDRQDVFDKWMNGDYYGGNLTTSATTPLSPPVSVFVCPSATGKGFIKGAPITHYAGNAGTGISGPASATTPPTHFRGDGVMVDTAPRIQKPMPFQPVAPGYNLDPFWAELATPEQAAIASSGTAGPIIRQTMTPDFINANDGLTNTLLFSERSGFYRVVAQNAVYAFAATPWDGRYQTMWNPLGSGTATPTPVRYAPTANVIFSINFVRSATLSYRNLPYWTGVGQIPIQCPVFGMAQSVPSAVINGLPTATNMAGCYPSSRHRGGVVAAFCDGRTVFLNDSLATHVYAQLITSSQVNSPAAINHTPAALRPYILDEKDYQ